MLCPCQHLRPGCRLRVLCSTAPFKNPAPSSLPADFPGVLQQPFHPSSRHLLSGSLVLTATFPSPSAPPVLASSDEVSALGVRCDMVSEPEAVWVSAGGRVGAGCLVQRAASLPMPMRGERAAHVAPPTTDLSCGLAAPRPSYPGGGYPSLRPKGLVCPWLLQPMNPEANR